MKTGLSKSHSNGRGALLVAALVGLFAGLCTPAGDARAVAARQSDASGFVTLALPPGGAVRVENQRGPVEVEVWDEPSVGVSSSGGESRATRRAARRRSPVQIEKTERLLSILVPRATAATGQGEVSLRVRLPRDARAQVFASAGAVELRGVPSQISAQTVSGDIRLSLPAGAGAEVVAHSLNGVVSFDGGGAGPAAEYAGRKFETRVGAGGAVARLFSGRGRIQIETRGESANVGGRSEDANARRPEPTPVEKPVARLWPDVVKRRPAPEQTDPATRPHPPGLPPPQSGDVPVRERDTSAAETAAKSPPRLEGQGAGQRPGAQPTPTAPEEVDEDEVIRVESDLVTVNVSVVDRAGGRGLVGLTREEFRLYEDNVEQQVEHFEAASAPFDLVLLIDLSGSTGRVTDLIRAATLRFIDAARAQDRIAVVTFAGATQVVSPLTADRAALRAAVRAMGPPVGDTRLYDASAAALELLDRTASPQRRRAVVLMSDGLDSTLPNVTGTGSQLSYEELRSRVEEFEGLFYSIWTSTEYEAFSPLDIQPETFDLAAQRMEALAETGGGVFYEVERLEDLAGAYERVVEDLGTVYSLSYRPTNRERDGRFRAIRVRVTRPNAVARGRRGYYAN